MVEGKYIVVEGVDGVGKSTLIAALRADYGFPVVRVWTEEFQQFRLNADLDYSWPHSARVLHYLASTLATSVRVDAMLRDSSVVGDRYLPSIMALSSTILGDSTDQVQDLVQRLLPYFRKPDLVLSLRAAPSTIRERLLARTSKLRGTDIFTIASEDFTGRFQHEIATSLQLLNFPHEVLDAEAPIELVLAQAKDVLRRRLGLISGEPSASSPGSNTGAATIE